MPLFWLSLTFLAGILLGDLLNFPVAIWTAALVINVLLAILAWIALRGFPEIRQRYAELHVSGFSIPTSLIIIFLILGAIRYQASQPNITPDFIAWYNDSGEHYVVEGVLVEPPDERDRYTNLRLKVDRLHPINELLFTPVEGLLLARVPPAGDYRYGDRLRLEGSLETPPELEGFSYREYLAGQGIHTYMSKANTHILLRNRGNPVLSLIYTFRARALVTLYNLFPDPEASLLAGILLGVESGIPEAVNEAFIATGTSHIIAISGFNITILAAFFTMVIGRLVGRRRRFWVAGITIVLIGFYAVMVGGDAAVVRAAIMGGLALLAALIGRRQTGLNTLAIVAAVMAFMNPNLLWDVAFQLSFAATLGLLIYAEPLYKWFLEKAGRWMSEEHVKRFAHPLSEYFLMTFAAMLVALPVTIYHFQRLSLISVLANPAILPAQPAVMILGGIAVLLGIIHQSLGELGAIAAWPFSAYTIRAVEFFSNLPSASVELGGVALFYVVMFYAVLFGWTFFGQRIRENWTVRFGTAQSQFTWMLNLILAGMAVGTVFVWRAASAAPDGRLHLTMMDVGSGDAFLVQTPPGRFLLIDGGPSPRKLSEGLGRRLPLTERRMDFLVLAGVGEGQLGALSRVIARFPPSRVLWAGSTAGSYSARQLREELASVGVTAVGAATGQSFDLGEGAELKVVYAGSRGAALLLTWKKFSALLPVGLDFESLELLMDDHTLVPVSVLFLPESGYAPLSPPEWIQRWNPQVVLLSVAADDPDGLPDMETLEAVLGYSLLRTDLNGWVHLSTDGEKLWVEVERK